MKNFFPILFFISLFLCLGCVSGPEKVSEGRQFNLYYSLSDKTKSIQEQSVMVIVPYGFNILEIDGKRKGIGLQPNDVLILQPGNHTFKWSYEGSESSNYQYYLTETTWTVTTYKAEDLFTFNFEAGQYYFFTGGRTGSKINILIKNLNEVEQIHISGYDNIPSQNVIEGLNNAIKRSMPK